MFVGWFLLFWDRGPLSFGFGFLFRFWFGFDNVGLRFAVHEYAFGAVFAFPLFKVNAGRWVPEVTVFTIGAFTFLVVVTHRSVHLARR